MSVDTDYAPKHIAPERKNFLGMDIVGDIHPSNRSNVTQRPKEELAPLLTALLDFPEVGGVKWYQYTPYFNDGDPCEFSTGEVYLLLAEDVDRVGLSEDGLDDEDYVNQDGRPWLSTYNDRFQAVVGKRGYDSEARQYTYSSVNEGLSKAWRDFVDAIGSGAFDHALLELFGDHAIIQVIAGKNIEVFTYEHE